MSHQIFKEELARVFNTVKPGKKFHSLLAKLRKRMERAFPNLKTPLLYEGVPDEILKTYALVIVTVIYDRNCTGTLTRKAVEKARTLLLVIEKKLNIDKDYLALGDKLTLSDLHLYGYLQLLITNYDNDHQLVDKHAAVMRVKFITELFKQYFADIDECSFATIEAFFDDEDYLRLYILAKLSYADMLLNADQELCAKLGNIADLHEINKIYTQILQRFSGTVHLSSSQIESINSAITELNGKIMDKKIRQQEELEELEDVVVHSLAALKTGNKRNFEQLVEQPQSKVSSTTSRFSFTATISVQMTIDAQLQSADKKQMSSEGSPPRLFSGSGDLG